jgi:hypothetical protein
MIIFNVVKEEYGWAVRMGEGMTTPFRSRAVAIREAGNLAQAIHRHGELAQVIVEGAVQVEADSSALTPVKAKALVHDATPE